MRRFDYRFLETIRLDSSFFLAAYSLGQSQERLKERLEHYPKLFGHLERIARLESIKASNAIEGIVIPEQRLYEIADYFAKPQSEGEAMIAGYRDCLDYISQNFRHLDLNQDLILSLHKMLYQHMEEIEEMKEIEKRGTKEKRTAARKVQAGAYKTRENAIAQVHPDQSSTILFTPVSACEVSQAMQLWLQAAKKIEHQSKILQIHPLLWSPCVILDFLCIHPFQDGNGRLSRLLSLLLLYQNGLTIPMAISLENEIYKNVDRYYKALRKADQHWHSNENDYSVFIQHFLETLQGCTQRLEEHISSGQRGKAEAKERIENAILDHFAPQSLKALQRLFPDLSSQEIQEALKQLIEEGRIESMDSSYTGGICYVKKF